MLSALSFPATRSIIFGVTVDIMESRRLPFSPMRCAGCGKIGPNQSRRASIPNNQSRKLLCRVKPGAFNQRIRRCCSRSVAASVAKATVERSTKADPGNAKIWMTTTNDPRKIVDEGISFNALCLTPDQSLLLADNPREQFVYSFHINRDGTLSARQPYHHLDVRDGDTESGAGGMAVDTRGMLYVCTPVGIQMCDQVGRMQGIISAPQGEIFSKLIIGQRDCTRPGRMESLLAS